MPWWKSVWLPPALVIVPVVMLLWGVIVPGGYYYVITVALVAWLLLGIAWVFTVVRHLARRHSASNGRPWWPLVVTPAVFVACWALASGDLPGRATFALHRDKLEQLAIRDAAAGRTTVGLYSFESVYHRDGCEFFAVKEPGFAKGAGFARCPGADPRGSQDAEDFEKLDGDWYVFLIRHELWQNRFEGARPWGLQLGELQKRTGA